MATGKNHKSHRTEKDKSSSVPAIGEGLIADSLEIIDNAVRQAFALRRDLFVNELVSRLRFSQSSEPEGKSVATAQVDWIGIESLSRLRSVVGGRFHNIKKKWIEAGFPLREHRGDKGGEVKVDDQGWIELTNWILKQGFEARLSRDNSEFLFELRNVSRE